MHTINAIEALAGVLICGVAAAVIILVVFVVYEIVWFKRNHKPIKFSKRVSFSIVTVLLCILATIMVKMPQIYYGNRVTRYEKYISANFAEIKEVKKHATRDLYKIYFSMDSDDIYFNTAETIFLASLDELCDADLRDAIKKSNLIDKRFGFSHISFIFVDSANTDDIIYEFIMTEQENYNNWKVVISREPEYLNKKYYLDIAPEPPVSSDIGRGLI